MMDEQAPINWAFVEFANEVESRLPLATKNQLGEFRKKELKYGYGNLGYWMHFRPVGRNERSVKAEELNLSTYKYLLIGAGAGLLVTLNSIASGGTTLVSGFVLGSIVLVLGAALSFAFLAYRRLAGHQQNVAAGKTSHELSFRCFVESENEADEGKRSTMREKAEQFMISHYRHRVEWIANKRAYLSFYNWSIRALVFAGCVLAVGIVFRL